ncbi:hypothetical protein CIL05_12590 [Virgibacillus profundi]|uniref:Uncharacterized protein n=1 Tax=Virgibacillus profundi TaxID=2024555 RepID=A0A2A2ICX5_9BACI|nr:hypothetical protein [Virgibacillus profundi]PAV29228.1 hypothetical protein CIL05_12590 [Virgibacillus profundi]PXY53397.1 hypothetical protein CIT14_12715 [Virgibacillus profundi]
MPKIFVHFTFFFFILTALSGVWMRAFPFYPDFSASYTNILHAHSHLAILGWAFLGVFIVFLSIYWKTIKRKNEAIALTCTIFVISFFMFLAFIYQGYAVYSIVLSTLHIFAEYWAASFIYRHIKANKSVPKSASLFIKGALIALIISSIGPYALAFISANGLKESYLFDMAIYFYLHFQYNGWLSLFLIGLFIILLYSKKVKIHAPLLNKGFWIYFIALFPGYFLSVLWADLGASAEILAVIGSIGQWIGVVCVLLAFKRTWKQIRKAYSTLTVTCIWIALVLLFGKSTMELGLITPSMAQLIYETRSVIIGYLHFTLLGFVSIFILAQYQMVSILPANQRTRNGFIIFFIGFILNELFLFSQALTEWFTFTSIPFYTQGLLAASLLLLIGLIMLWISFKFRKLGIRQAFRRMP